jgi:transcriptional regulator with XRE-family HTH domain
MTDTSDLNARIGARVRELRTRRGQSLDALAAQSGVSRSMISLVERGEASPTAVVLEKLATGLGVMLASLFESPEASAESEASPVSRRADQIEWIDPDSGYRRRNVSPPGVPLQLVEVSFPPRARVAFETGARDPMIHQLVWVLEGTMNITLGESRYMLDRGDCLAMQLDRPIVFYNPTQSQTRYAVVITSDPTFRR